MKREIHNEASRGRTNRRFRTSTRTPAHSAVRLADSWRIALTAGRRQRAACQTRSSATRKALVLALALLAVAAAGCGGSDRAGTAEPTIPPTTTQDTTPTEAPSTGPSSPAPQQLLHSEGLGAVRFGEPADTALPLLFDTVGRQATNDSANLDAASQGFGGTTVRFVHFGPLTVVFSDGTYHRDDGLSHFAGWALSKDSAGFATRQGITVGSTVDDLRSAYGDQLELSTDPSECTGTWVFRVGPTELGLEGELSAHPPTHRVP